MAVRRQKGRLTWQARVYVPGRGYKQVTTGTTDKAEALAFERQLRLSLGLPANDESERRRWVEEVVTRMLGSKPADGVPLRTAIDTYLAVPTVRLSKREMATRRLHWKKWANYLAEVYPKVEFLHHVVPAMAVSWLDALLKQGKSGKTVNNMRASVQTVFRVLGPRAGLGRSPFDGVGMVPAESVEHGRAFTSAEIKRMLTTTKGTEWEGAILVALYTGARYTDVAHMRWDAVKKGVWEYIPAKTSRHGIRGLVPLHRKVLAWLKTRERRNEYVFPFLASRYHGGDDAPRFSRDVLTPAEIDVKGHVTFHCLRHTWATRMSATGAGRAELMRAGGWTQAQTASLYNHDLKSLRAAIARLK